MLGFRAVAGGVKRMKHLPRGVTLDVFWASSSENLAMLVVGDRKGVIGVHGSPPSAISTRCRVGCRYHRVAASRTRVAMFPPCSHVPRYCTSQRFRGKII